MKAGMTKTVCAALAVVFGLATISACSTREVLSGAGGAAAGAAGGYYLGKESAEDDDSDE